MLATTATANARVTADVADQIGHRRPGPARQPRPGVAAARGRPAQDGAAAAGLAGRPPRRAARLRHRLLPHGGGDPGDRRLPPLARPRRGGVLRTDRDHRAPGPRAGPHRWSGQGADRHQRPGHGLRRGARLRGQHGRTAVAGRLLPAGRARRPRPPPDAAPPWSCCRRSRTATSGPTSPRSPSRARSRSAQTLAGARRRGRPMGLPTLETRVELNRTRLETMLKVLDVDGAVRRVTGGLGGDRPGLGLRRGPLRRVARGARARAAGDARLPRDRPSAGCSTSATSSTTRTPQPCGRCDNCGGLTLSTDVSEAAVEEADAAAVPTRECRSSRAGCGRPRWPTSASTSRARSPRVPRRAGSVARLTDLGYGQALRDLFRDGTPDGPVPDALARAVVAVLRDWRPDGRRDRRRRVRDPPDPHRRPGRRAVALPPGAGRRPVGDRRPRRRTRPGPGQLRAAGRRPSAAAGPCRPTSRRRAAVLLVDDRIVTGWTLTLAARAIRKAGAGRGATARARARRSRCMSGCRSDDHESAIEATPRGTAIVLRPDSEARRPGPARAGGPTQTSLTRSPVSSPVVPGRAFDNSMLNFSRSSTVGCCTCTSSTARATSRAWRATTPRPTTASSSPARPPCSATSPGCSSSTPPAGAHRSAAARPAPGDAAARRPRGARSSTRRPGRATPSTTTTRRSTHRPRRSCARILAVPDVRLVYKPHPKVTTSLAPAVRDGAPRRSCDWSPRPPRASPTPATRRSCAATSWP